MVRIAVIALVGLILPGPLAASPISLLCRGSFLSFPGPATSNVEEAAQLDVQLGTIKLPIYGYLEIEKTEPTVLFFKGAGFVKGARVLVNGSLDRITGLLNVSAMEPAERKKMEAGHPAQTVSMLDAKCRPAQPLF